MAEYLKQFELSWVFVCEHIYHRWVTTKVISLLRMNPMEIPSFPFFSIDFVESVLEWPKHWKQLERFHNSPAEVARRKRIFEGQRLLQKVKGTHLDKSEIVFGEEPATKENDWRGILIHIRTLWQECARACEMDPRENRCRTCDSPIQALRHCWDCGCRTCATMGGMFPYLGGWEFQNNLRECTRCYRALQLAITRSTEKRDFTYHLSWAVFKHLPGRLEYIVKDLQLAHLCVFPPQRCSRIECLVAQNIILGHYPKEMAEFLVANYRPVDECVRYQVQPQTSVRNIFVTLYEERKLKVEVLIALLAEVNGQRSVPDKGVFGELLKKYITATGKDVQFDMTAYPESDRSDFMANGASFPGDLVNEICQFINPVHHRGAKDMQVKLRERHSASSIELCREMTSRYKAFVMFCRFFVENEFVSGGDRKSTTTGRSRKTKDQQHDHNNPGHHSHGHQQQSGCSSSGHGHSHSHDHEEHSECCSLFGHGGEWQRSRSAETRERLRKTLQLRLQLWAQQNGNKETGAVAPKSKSIQRKTIDKNENGNRGFYKTLENVLMKIPQMNLPHRSRALPELDQLNLRDMLNRAGGDFPRDPFSPPASPATPDSISEELLRVQCKVEELQERFGNISLDAMVDYIEGTRCKPKANDGGLDADKKAAKKLKQKQKKQEQKRTEELQELRALYHVEFSVEAELRSKLKSLKAAKKKDKKKVQDLELDVKKASRIASKTESSICEIICELREFNPEFKFNYQPPKEPKPARSEAPSTSGIKPPVLSIPPPIIPPSIPMNFMGAAGNENAFSQFVAMQRQGGLPQFKVPVNVMGTTVTATTTGAEDDPSKRMVTIRRVNLPHAEPQVTVMAKGQSPDQDRLLYSFINGQMVPASSLVPQPAVKGQTSVPLNPPTKAAQQQGKKAATVAPPVVSGKTANKNNKKAKAAEVVKKADDSKKEQLKKPENKEPTIEKPAKDKAGKAGKNSKVEQKKAAPEKPSTEATQAESKSKKAQKKTTAAPPPIVAAKLQPEPAVVVAAKPKKVKKEPRVEYLDPSFNKNKFDLLCLNDDDDEDVGHSESEVESDEEVVVIPPPKPAQAKKPVAVPQTTTVNEKAGKKQGNAPVIPPQAKKEKKNAPPVVVAHKPEPEPVVNISKKERRKLARQNKEQHHQSNAQNGEPEENDPVEKAVKRAEKMAESLTTEMNKLNLNADTTIELINPFARPQMPNPFLTNPHITEQLNRGINVGGLQLPPGITLTKLDPAKAKEMQRKKEAINRASQPVAKEREEAPPQVIMANPAMNGVYGGAAASQGQANGQYVVIENPELTKKTTGNKPSKKEAKNAAAAKKQEPVKPIVVNGKRQNGKNKENQRQQVQQKILQSRKDKLAATGGQKNAGANNSQSNQMVTLRNPMFHTPSGSGPSGPTTNAPPPVGPSGHQNPIRLRSSTGQVMDTPAAIIQNDNGMFTIRNPALHHAYTNHSMGGLVGGTMSPQPVQEIPIESVPQAWKLPVAGAAAPGGPSTNTKAIGSEMKQKKEPWQPDMQYPKMGYHTEQIHHPHHRQSPSSRSYSPFDSQLNLSTSYNGHNPIAVGGGQAQAAATTAPPPGYLGKAGFSAFVTAEHGCGGGDSDGHQCEDPHPSSLVGDQKYFREPPLMNLMNQNPYNDFLHNLQPGQRLNSEVRRRFWVCRHCE